MSRGKQSIMNSFFGFILMWQCHFIQLPLHSFLFWFQKPLWFILVEFVSNNFRGFPLQPQCLDFLPFFRSEEHTQLPAGAPQWSELKLQRTEPTLTCQKDRGGDWSFQKNLFRWLSLFNGQTKFDPEFIKAYHYYSTFQNTCFTIKPNI